MSVQIRRLTGVGPTSTDITSINTRLNAEDAHSTAGTTNPILRPAAGTNFSYWCVTQLFFNGTGVGTVNNIRWFTDGANGLGAGRGLRVGTATAYTPATGTLGVTGTELTAANYPSFTLGNANAFVYTSASPLVVAGTITNPTNAAFGDRVVMQYTVDNTALAGPGATETISWRFDSTIP